MNVSCENINVSLCSAALVALGVLYNYSICTHSCLFQIGEIFWIRDNRCEFIATNVPDMFVLLEEIYTYV